MIQTETRLDVADNTGAKSGPVHQGAGRFQASLCQRGRHHQGQRQRPLLVVASKGRIYSAVVVRTAKGIPPWRWFARQV